MSDFPDIGIAVRSLLLANSEVNDAFAGSIISDQLPQTITPPAAVFWIVSEIEEDDLNGPTGFASARLQIDCYGVTRPAATQLSRLVRSVLAGFRGVVGGVFVLSITQASGQQYLTDRPERGGDQHRTRTSQDFFIHYRSNAKVS